MPSGTDRFLQAEEMAERLSRALGDLQDAAKGYGHATEELELARQRLVALIDQTGQLAEGTHEVIKTLKEIGAPEILARLESLSTDVRNLNSATFNQQKRIKVAAVVGGITLLLVAIEAMILLLK